MRKHIDDFTAKVLKKALVGCFALLSVSSALADGSKDLYPAGGSGHRAYLLGKGYTAPEAIPFPNAGAHYVYAKEGETITMASSAQGPTKWGDSNGGITLFNPNGSKVIDDNKREGQIPNRTAELAGPKKIKEDSKGGYIPINYKVPKGGEGIYRVEFTSRGTSGQGNVFSANENWTQGDDAAIVAWDVSVLNSNGNTFIPGRVYTTNMNFSNGNFSYGSNYQDIKFNGEFFVRTNDGFTYRVKHNGTSGIVWAFFTNSIGFKDDKGNSIYKSLNEEASSASKRIHNPNTPDDSENITHKMFYTFPAEDMPSKAIVSVGDGKYYYPNRVTWLNPSVLEPEVQNVHIVGAEGTDGVIGHKGGYVVFDAPVAGQQYTIEILNNNNVFFTLEGNTKEGVNRVFWDGKNKAGQKLAEKQGSVPIEVKVQLQGAEVHFPFFDIEYNTGGIAIELLDYKDLMGDFISDKVFWDDSDIRDRFNNKKYWNGDKVDPIENSHTIKGNQGISSNVNGHKWGAGGTGALNTFGDKKSMDTWTFRVGNKVNKETFVEVKEADLYTTVSSSINGKPNPTIGNFGEAVVYTVTAGNKGPSDIIADSKKGIKGAPFTFQVPGGVEITNVKIISQKGVTENVRLTYDKATRMYHAELSMHDKGTITYQFEGKLVGGIGNQVAEATIMRPADVTDPDATNGDPKLAPTNPHFECYNNDTSSLGTSSGSIGCNNITETSFMLLGPCVDAVLYYEDFDRGYWNVNSGRTDWTNRASISLNADGSIQKNQQGNTIRNGAVGGATSTYSFAPGINDKRYPGYKVQNDIARIPDGHYAVLPPGYVRMGLDDRDPWKTQTWYPNHPEDFYDWTPAWDQPGAIRDMSGAVNGAAFLIRGAASATQSIKPFYEFEVKEPLKANTTYTLDLYSYVTYHDKDYMLIDVIDTEGGQILATVPLKFAGTELPEGAAETGFSLGWVPLTASFRVDDTSCKIDGKKVKVAIRGSQDRALVSGKGFGHTILDNIAFTRRSSEGCTIKATPITCADLCYTDVVGKGFGWDYKEGVYNYGSILAQKFTQPGTNGGFVVDVYQLDNSFNMVINGVPLYKDELEFESGDANRNVRFKSDKSTWGPAKAGDLSKVSNPNVWDVNSNAKISLVDRLVNPTPVIRVIIDKWGNVKLFGKRTTNSLLEELEVFDKVTKAAVMFEKIHWISDEQKEGANKIDVTQLVKGATKMIGFGYGQKQKDCETCTLEKDGVFNDNNKDKYADIGETITYTFKVKNAGDMDIYDVAIIDPLFGFNISIDEKTKKPVPNFVSLAGDKNNDGILNRNEVWTFEVDYKITKNDIFANKGVYNRAAVKGVGILNTTKMEFEVDSTDPTPYKKGDLGWDPERPYHTFVPLKGRSLLITNPNIYQKIK